VSILLENVADLNVMDCIGHTALHYSVCSEKTSVVAKLLVHKANFESQTKVYATQDYFQDIRSLTLFWCFNSDMWWHVFQM
jgi:ankyrin repeat protein